MNSSTQLARYLVRRLIENGVKEVVLSPGSRNAPLSIALYVAEQRGLIALHMRIDERTAGFFALGIAKAALRPVAVVCTSGTAVANYHPAVLEARHSQIPLLVITADRPARLRETGANQTTLQAGIFGNATTYAIDVSDPTVDLIPVFLALHIGPVHVNVQFDEPLLPDDASDWCQGISGGKFKANLDEGQETLTVGSARGVIVVGHDRAGFTPAAVSAFAAEIGWPVIAEDPLSFPQSVAHASLFLASEKIRGLLRPEAVIVIGRTTLSRSTNTFVKSAEKEIVVDPRIATVDSKRSADQVFRTLPKVTKKFDVEKEWDLLWSSYSQKTVKLLTTLPDWSEANIARSFAQGLPAGSTLFISSSRPIRDIEGFATPRASIETFANRGLAGIDGNISTALGIASQRHSTLAIMGDLAFLHDMTGLIGVANINLRILVINNDGGGIFSTLPQDGVPGFEKIFGTPHGLDPAAIARSMGIKATTVDTIDQLQHEMSLPISGLSVVIANVPNRDTNANTLRELSRVIDSI
ncbi:MAG TPA: 2-succinyl-5-enolpyruvyl-6-hydroxy-3-cyclohexene-1-carboxylic-acid synthase [Candidatus Nanopelagicaceae bacterium]